MMNPYAKLMWIVVRVTALVLPARAENLQAAGRQLTPSHINISKWTGPAIEILIFGNGGVSQVARTLNTSYFSGYGFGQILDVIRPEVQLLFSAYVFR